MQTLTPNQAALIADKVYDLRKQSIPADGERRNQLLGCRGLFDVQDTSRFQGTSGSPLYRPLSGFGYMAQGVGEFAGHMLCATRGTASLADWITDANVGMQAGPSGHQVHIGFNMTWKSYIDEVRIFLRGKNPTHIHCVGHSLGGALAMLNADFFTSSNIAGVSIYTFGAPRVGSQSFSADLTKRVGADRVFRVSHIADPVPMIPTFPFLHLPYAAPSFVIGSGLFDFGAHSMTKSYGPRVEHLNWDSFPTDATQQSDDKIEAWLSSSSGAGAIKMYSAYALHMIGQALKWLLKKTGMLLGVVISAATGALTLLDRIAWMLEKGAELDRELDFYTAAIIGAALRFLGRAANTVQQLTRAYLRWVFGLLFSALNAAAATALDVVNNDI